MKFLFNILWVILGGLVSAISHIVMGVGYCLTILLIPIGLQHFKIVPLVFAPAGKEVATKYSRHPVMNTLWLIFGGFANVILFGVLGAVFCITIIGFPFGMQFFKLAKFSTGPFGAEIVHEGRHTSKLDTKYDYELLYNQIAADPDRVLRVEGDYVHTVRKDIMQHADEIRSLRKKTLILDVLEIIAPNLLVALLIFVTVSLIVIWQRFMWSGLGFGISIVVIFLVVVFLLGIIPACIRDYIFEKFVRAKLGHLMTFYANEFFAISIWKWRHSNPIGLFKFVGVFDNIEVLNNKRI